MSEMWQQIGVWAMIALAAVITVYSSIKAWRALRRGECGNCAGCGGQAADPVPTDPSKKERIVFLPADQLKLATRRKSR